MVTTKEAIEIILNSAEINNTYEEVYVSNCLERVCSEPVKSKIDIPTFTRSSMDGFAIAFGKDNRYKILSEKDGLTAGECVRVNTGFPIPKGADAVVEIEKTEIINDTITTKDVIEPERNFTKRGSELKKGDILVDRNEKINIRKRALLAYAGVVSLKVFRKPTVGIITTGDEVVFPGCDAPKNSVFNSNFFILDGLVKKWGVNTVYFGHIPDEKGLFEERLLYALYRCDIVVTTGGVSKGTRDYAKDVLNRIKAEVLFDKSTIKPGKPAAFASYKDKFIFSLPGWPAALYTTAYIYLKPFLLKISGNSSYDNTVLEGIVDEDMHSRKGKDYFNRVKINYRKGEFHLTSAGSQKTDNYLSIAEADGLVWLDTEIGDKKKGSRLPFIFFDD